MFLAISLLCFVLGFVLAIGFLKNRPEKVQNEVDKVLEVVSTKLPIDVSSLVQEKPARKLRTKSEVENDFNMDTWQRLAYEDFKIKILAKDTGMKTFPCVYATMGYRSDDHRYVFLESDNAGASRNIRIIGPALSEYLKVAHSLGPNTSLVIIGKPSEGNRTVTDYNNTFWDMLRGLRIYDQKAWPQEIPTKIASEKWTFAYDGEPIFPVMLTPAHSRRWSRQMSVPVIAIQPKWVLDNLLGTPEKREAAQSKVRKLIKEYDQTELSPDLTSYGAPGTSESRQLCLLDENESAHLPFVDLDD